MNIRRMPLRAVIARIPMYSSGKVLCELRCKKWHHVMTSKRDNDFDHVLAMGLIAILNLFTCTRL